MNIAEKFARIGDFFAADTGTQLRYRAGIRCVCFRRTRLTTSSRLI